MQEPALLAAYQRAVHEFAEPLKTFAARMLAEDAEWSEDVAQDAMLRLWKIAPQWDPDRAKVSTWLYRVVANLCTDRLRRGGRGVALDAIPEPPDTAPTGADRLQDQGRQAALRAAGHASALRAALGSEAACLGTDEAEGHQAAEEDQQR